MRKNDEERSITLIVTILESPTLAPEKGRDTESTMMYVPLPSN